MKKLKKLSLCITLSITMAATAILAGGCSGSGSGAEAGGEKVKVASKDFTENEIVAEVYALALEDAGLEVDRVFDVGSSVIHSSLISDEIDLYPEYTGTGLISILNKEPVTDPQEVYDIVKEEYEKQFHVTWLDYSAANDGQGLVIRTKTADQYGIKTISDMQKYADKLRFASQGEFDERADGIPALEAPYGELNWKSSKVYDNSLKYQVLANDEADVSPAYTTEGRLTEDQFLLLVDDKQVWPPYNLAPVVRDSVLEAHPEIEETLNKVSAAFTTENITALNAKVDIDGEEYTDVAKEFYDSIK